MRILVVGGGGREHALCWAIAKSPLCDALYCAPGNGGIARVATCIDIGADDVAGLVRYAVDEAIDFVVVGPEQPLVAGVVDRLEAAGIAAFGPTAAAARLEGSKGFMKDLCAANAIPTAAYRRFDAADAACAWIEEIGRPMVVKADGLAAGKGVTVAASVEEAKAAARAALETARFGNAGSEIVVEELLVGEELSFFALVDGTFAMPLTGAKDHKRAFDNDEGPNTGGMGALSPAASLTPELEVQVMKEAIAPTVAAMAAAGHAYKGVLYAGFMLTSEGPKLLEYNVRFGDPETQVLTMRLQSDLLPALMATRDESLSHITLKWRDEAAVTVVMATKGYPGVYEKGSEIKGLDIAGQDPDVEIFHAGTAAQDGRIMAVGGRVLNVTARGATVGQARARAYDAVAKIDWPEGFYRRDIAG
ncbi:MAG: phosphoribosylamine--glycine ligase [Alphaproteobacteria bacterium]|nr:phosphoribosylamine--glycine ligase [Alphaproteobacteria bacterium]